MGSSILLKEENDKTIEYLNSVPVKRTNIVISKILCGVVYIFLMILTLAIFNFIGLELSGDFDKKTYILLSITPLFSSIVILADIRNVIVDVAINPYMVAIALILSVIFMFLTLVRYNKKELV